MEFVKEFFTSTVHSVVHQVLEVVVLALLGVAFAAATKYLQKLGISVNLERDLKMREIAQAIVLAVEEQIEHAYKSGRLSGPPEEKSALKRDTAVARIMCQLPTLDKTTARNLADEAVARVGLGASATVVQ